MGKYKETPGENWKIAIANELAEANRLKRLELERTLTWSKNSLKVLEDQA